MLYRVHLAMAHQTLFNRTSLNEVLSAGLEGFGLWCLMPQYFNYTTD